MVTGTTGGQTTIGDELGINRNHRLQTPEEIAEAVTTARKYLDWKQAALAYEAGVNERTIQRLEKGQKVNDDTRRKVAKALGLAAGDFVDAGFDQSTSDGTDVLWSVALVASGLHGDPLGFGHFIRALPDTTLQATQTNDALVVLVVAHAMLIVEGRPDIGIDQDRVDVKAVHRIRIILTIEHLRRIGLLRARYPRDPFTDVPETAWWTGHPFLEPIQKLPADQRAALLEVLLYTGDLGILAGHIVTLPADKLERILAQVQGLDDHRSEYLDYLEQQYGDSETIAWAEPMDQTKSRNLAPEAR